jgi:hypothetical protein
MPRKRGDRVEEIGSYKLSDEPPPKRRYRPMPGVKASSEREPDEFDKPVLKRFLGADPFPWALAVCVLVWVALGLAATKINPFFGLVLILAGTAVIFLSQVWLYVSILMEDREAGILSIVCGLYRVFYLYMNPEVAWRPGVLAAVGVFMMVTGFATFVSQVTSGP